MRFFLGIKSAFVCVDHVCTELSLGNLTLSRWAALLYIERTYLLFKLTAKYLSEIEVFVQKIEC
jgi:hypothetical protein